MRHATSNTTPGDQAGRQHGRTRRPAPTHRHRRSRPPAPAAGAGGRRPCRTPPAIPRQALRQAMSATVHADRRQRTAAVRALPAPVAGADRAAHQPQHLTKRSGWPQAQPYNAGRDQLHRRRSQPPAAAAGAGRRRPCRTPPATPRQAIRQAVSATAHADRRQHTGAVRGHQPRLRALDDAEHAARHRQHLARRSGKPPAPPAHANRRQRTAAAVRAHQHRLLALTTTLLSWLPIRSQLRGLYTNQRLGLIRQSH
jgi:hypothetical protein